MQTVGKAVMVLLAEQAKERAGQEDKLLHIAERCDPELFRLMRRVADAQYQLDAYVLGRIPTPRSG